MGPELGAQIANALAPGGPIGADGAEQWHEADFRRLLHPLGPREDEARPAQTRIGTVRGRLRTVRVADRDAVMTLRSDRLDGGAPGADVSVALRLRFTETPHERRPAGSTWHGAHRVPDGVDVRLRGPRDRSRAPPDCRRLLRCGGPSHGPPPADVVQPSEALPRGYGSSIPHPSKCSASRVATVAAIRRSGKRVGGATLGKDDGEGRRGRPVERQHSSREVFRHHRFDGPRERVPATVFRQDRHAGAKFGPGHRAAVQVERLPPPGPVENRRSRIGPHRFGCDARGNQDHRTSVEARPLGHRLARRQVEVDVARGG